MRKLISISIVVLLLISFVGAVYYPDEGINPVPSKFGNFTDENNSLEIINITQYGDWNLTEYNITTAETIEV